MTGKWLKLIIIMSVLSGLIPPSWAVDKPLVDLIYAQAPTLDCGDTPTSSAYTTTALSLAPQQCALYRVSLTNKSNQTLEQLTVTIPLDPALTVLAFKQGNIIKLESKPNILPYPIQQTLAANSLSVKLESLAANQAVAIYFKVRIN